MQYICTPMCGITGFVDFKGKSNLSTLKSMSDALIHRGPDDEGQELLTHDSTQIGLGFRRLAIIDLTTAGHQPMKSDDGKYQIVFNGEIYNHAEIRKLLESDGYHFRSNSDTEVILNAYRNWGLKCLDYFRGMFAIAIYDWVADKLILIRDRAGVKPLYWYFKNDLLLFGSELKTFHRHPAFEKELNHDAIGLYFQHGYIPAPHCIFKNTHKLIPGHYLTIDLKSKNIADERYWNVTDFYNKPKLKIDFTEALTETEKILSKSFNYRMVSDVPVGVFLSGGYDSSLVTALLQKDSTKKIKTFTIGFEEESYNEAHYARKVANHLGSEHHDFFCTYKEAMDIIPMIPEIADEPLADSSIIPTYLVSKMARQQVTVALSADGGDETFAGYTKYAKATSYLNKLKQIPDFAKSLSQIPVQLWTLLSQKNLAVPDRAHKLQLLLKSQHDVDAFNIITQGMTQIEVRKLMNQDVAFPSSAFDEYEQLKSSDLLDNFLWLDYKTFLPDDILQKVDRATMAVSLEGREPLLDHHIIEWAAQLPSNFKLKGQTGKHILRQITHQYIPKEIMEREKMGFNIPYEKWFKVELKELLIQTLNTKTLNEQQILNTDEIDKMINMYLQNAPTNFQRLWAIFVFQLWFNKWM